MSSILLKRIENLPRSKALIKSSTLTIGIVPALGRCSTTSVTNHVYWDVLVLALKPNWRLSLVSRFPHSTLLKHL